MREIGLFPLLPVRLSLALSRVSKAVRACRHHSGHVITKPIADILQPRLAALILDAVMKKRRDGQVFVPTVLQDSRRHRQQMSNVRCRCSLADLSPMNMRRVYKRAIKSICQDGRTVHCSGPPPIAERQAPCQRAAEPDLPIERKLNVVLPFCCNSVAAHNIRRDMTEDGRAKLFKENNTSRRCSKSFRWTLP